VATDCREEALYHALAAGDILAAEQLLVQHRHDLMNREQWHQLECWLRLFPAESVEMRPDLLLLRAWLNYFHWYSPESLTHDLALAQALASKVPGGFIRPFLDLGPPMFDLLNRLAKRKSDIRYIGKLLTAFRNERNAEALPESPDSHHKGPDSV
jgi:hypothetical protein